jgi:predicted RNA-binding protein with PIN domain
VLWVVDGNNVMGAGADGWWNDPVAAAARLAATVAAWTNEQAVPVVLVFDGSPQPSVARQAGGDLEVRFADRPGRDGADHTIVALVDERYGTEPDLTVVTSDRGLIARLPPGVAVEGAGAFRGRLGLATRSSGRPGRSGRSGPAAGSDARLGG